MKTESHLDEAVTSVMVRCILTYCKREGGGGRGGEGQMSKVLQY